jgi:hypothetical protein
MLYLICKSGGLSTSQRRVLSSEFEFRLNAENPALPKRSYATDGAQRHVSLLLKCITPKRNLSMVRLPRQQRACT